jgi:hypothetical protein
MERIIGVDQFGADFNDSEVAQSIKEAQASLSVQMDRIGTAFEETVDLYRKLDNMITEEAHVPAQAA